MLDRHAPYPYSFLVRRLGEARDKNIGFMTKLFDEPGVPWTEDVFGGIPGVLNRGGSEINFGENVEYSGWDRLDRGGMGAEFANDRTRYRFAAGAYCGDPGEIYPQPKTFSPTYEDGDVPLWEPKGVVFPPYASTRLAGGVVAGMTPELVDLRFNVENIVNFRVGAACRIWFSAPYKMDAGSNMITIAPGLFGAHDDDEHVSIAVGWAGPNYTTLYSTVASAGTPVETVANLTNKATLSIDALPRVLPDTPPHAGAYAVWSYERRINKIEPATAGATSGPGVIEVDRNLVNLGPRNTAAIAAGQPLTIRQLDQKVVDIVLWRIPPAVPNAMEKPTTIPVVTADSRSTLMETDDKYYIVYTKLSPWGESLPSDPSSTLLPADISHPFAVTNQCSLAIQFGSNKDDITDKDLNGITYKANTKDYPGVTGYRIYAHKVESTETSTPAYNEEKLKLMAEITITPNQQVNGKLKPRHVYKGEPLLEQRPPEYVTGGPDERRDMVIVLTTDDVRTYLYRLEMQGEHPTLHPIQAVSDADESVLAPGIRGTITPHSVTVWNSQLVIPTTSFSGRQAITRVWYDGTKGLHASGYSLKFRYRVSEGILGHLVYAENTRRLWRVYRNLAYWSSDPFGGVLEWTGPIAIGTNEYDVAQMIAYGGAKNSSDSATYFTKPDGLYRILDTNEGPSRRAEWITTFGVPDLNYGYPLIDHRGELYIGIGENMLRYTIANVDLTGPNRDRGLVQSLRGWCGGAISTNRHLYVGTGMRHPDKTHPFYQQILETEQGEAWHQIRWHGKDGNDIIEVMEDYPLGPDTGLDDGVGWGPILQVVPADMSPLTGAITDGNGWTTMVATVGFREGIEVFPIRNAGERLREARGYKPRTEPAMLELPKTFSGNNRPLDQVWHYLRVEQVKLTRPDNHSGFRVKYKLDNPYKPVDYQFEMLTYSTLFGQYKHYLTVDNTMGEIKLHDLEGGTEVKPPEGWPDTHWVYAYERVVQFISGGMQHEFLPPPDDAGYTSFPRPIIRSPGIAFRIDINQAVIEQPEPIPPGWDPLEDIPMVLGTIVLASSPSTVPLGRWIFEAVLKRYQQLARKTNGTTIENMTSDEFYLAYEKLLSFAKRSDPLVLTDALGAEHVVRMDLGHVSPGKDGLKTWTKPDVDEPTGTRVIVEPYELRYTVTFTELYNLDDMEGYVLEPIVPV